MFENICLNEEFFNITKFVNTSQPRFSECFEDIFQSWTLSLTAVCLIPAHLWNLRQSQKATATNARQQYTRRKIQWTSNSAIRVLLLFLIIINNWIRFVYDFYSFITHDSSQNVVALFITTILSPFLNIISYSLFTYTVYKHRRYGIYTSWITFTIALVSLIVSLPAFYDSIMFLLFGNNSPVTYKHQEPAVRTLYAYQNCVECISLFIIFVLTCLPDRLPNVANKSPYSVREPLLLDEQLNMKKIKNSPIENCSFFSRITFSFATGLLSKGYRNILNIEDIWIVPKSESNHQVYENWKKMYCKTNKSVLFTMLRSPLYYGATILKIIVDCMMFVKPQLLKLFLGLFVPGANYPAWTGYALVGAFFCSTILKAMLANNFYYLLNLLALRVRSGLTSAIYQRSLQISNEERSKTTSGEIINLVSVDAQRLSNFMHFVHLVYSAPLQIILGLYFLYVELGVAIFAGVFCFLLMIPVNRFLSNYQEKTERQQMIRKDERLKNINEILNGIKVIKLYGWEVPFIDKISAIRNLEVQTLKALGMVYALNVFIWHCMPIIVLFASFAVYIAQSADHVLTTQKAFVSLALFEALTYPFGEISTIVTECAIKMVSVRRLEKFFNNTKDIENYAHREKIHNGKTVIQIENGTFTWKHVDTAPELRDINLRIKKGSIVAIVGNVATGKSSLLNAILGNMRLLSGRVSIDSDARIAYVAQQAWIQNATLKDNILFGKDFHTKSYRTIVNICALDSDFAALPAGDMTEIGERGINLSGGQKQRVAMARACYSDSDLFLFDDPLSAVDSHVGKHIFDHVLSSKTGYLKHQTRVLVTNSIQFLPEVDQIIVLSNGQISDIGTYHELIENGSNFADFLQEHSSSLAAPGTPEESKNIFERQNSAGKYSRTFSIESNTESENLSPVEQLIEDEKIEIGKVKWKIYLKYFQAFTYLWLLLMIGSYLFMEVAVFSNGIWLAFWSQSSAVSSTNSSSVPVEEHSQMYYLYIYGSISLLSMFLLLLSMIMLTMGVLKTSVTFHQKLIYSVMRSPMSFFDTTPIGRILNRISKDIDSIDTEMGSTMESYLYCYLHLIGVFILIIYKLPIFALILLPLLIVYRLLSNFFIATSRQIQRLESITKSPIYSHFTESLSGMATIRAYGVEERFLQEMSQRIDTNIRCSIPRQSFNRWLSLRLELIGSFILLLVTALILIYRDSFITVPGLIGLLVSYSMYLTDNLNWSVRASAEMENNIVSVERIQEYFEQPTEAEWRRKVNAEPELPVQWPQGRIEFINYSLRYRPGLELVIKDLNFQINSGEKIGIVGRTGAGKSSLTLALFRIVEPASGNILVDGIDIKQIGLHELRSKLSIIPQDPILFSGTIRSNLDPFRTYSDETVWKALEHSHLKEFVKSLPEGLEYVVAENGENLSVGQRQLICLGRALLRHTAILILDEATASVDLETDSLIQNTIRKEFVGSTIITIAHRLNTILDYDRVMVLDHGRLVEFDSPDNLLSNTASQFYSLAKDARLIS